MWAIQYGCLARERYEDIFFLFLLLGDDSAKDASSETPGYVRVSAPAPDQFLTAAECSRGSSTGAVGAPASEPDLRSKNELLIDVLAAASGVHHDSLLSSHQHTNSDLQSVGSLELPGELLLPSAVGPSTEPRATVSLLDANGEANAASVGDRCDSHHSASAAANPRATDPSGISLLPSAPTNILPTQATRTPASNPHIFSLRPELHSLGSSPVRDNIREQQQHDVASEDRTSSSHEHVQPKETSDPHATSAIDYQPQKEKESRSIDLLPTQSRDSTPVQRERPAASATVTSPFVACPAPIGSPSLFGHPSLSQPPPLPPPDVKSSPGSGVLSSRNKRFADCMRPLGFVGRVADALQIHRYIACCHVPLCSFIAFVFNLRCLLCSKLMQTDFCVSICELCHCLQGCNKQHCYR